jgi:HD superfamily phosphohydrolase
MMMARGLMYSAVYFHRVTRITEIMLSRAVERSVEDLPDSIDLQKRVDSEIWGALYDSGKFARDMIRRLKYRQLLKISTSRRKQDLPEETIEKLIRLASNSSERIELEDKIAERAGLDEGYVAIDVPSVKLLLSEPRMSQVDIRIIGDDGKTRWFKDHTPIAEALRKRQVSQEVVYVMTLPGYEKIVSRLADEHIFS